MSRPRGGLGRGLSELIRGAGPAAPGGSGVSEIELELIDPNPMQPRRDFDPAELAELAASIATQGLLQPVLVRPAGGRYQLVAGERRLRATRDLGHLRIRAIVREISDAQLLELALIENIQRADLNDIEVAEALAQLMERHGYTTPQLAELLGKSRPAVANTLRLLDLPQSVQALIRAGSLSASHGRAILALPSSMREEAAIEAAAEGKSVRALERAAAELAQRQQASSTPGRAQTVSQAAGTARRSATASAVARAEHALMEYLGTKVSIGERGEGGTITISYHGAEDLERLLELLLAGRSPV